MSPILDGYDFLHAGRVASDISNTEADNPVARRPGCPHRPLIEVPVPHGGSHNMLRVQRALPERYTKASSEQLAHYIDKAKQILGNQVFILGHHYQRDEVMAWADARGDSFRLSVLAQQHPEAKYIVFCGVHFMAESADILTGDHQQVLLPDLNAGCSMADMADIDQVEQAWNELALHTDIQRVVPVTYMNSAADLKAFTARNGGAVCTSSNAQAVLSWALERGEQVLFFPDQHLGRNTGFGLGYSDQHMQVWNPRMDLGGLSEAQCKEAVLLLWKGHCSVHQRFQPEHLTEFRAQHPNGIVIVHPECSREVCAQADQVGSTDYIIKAVAKAPAGSVIGVGTEIHLINRLNNEAPDKTVISLDPLVCPCSTMFRINAAHLAWTLEGLTQGKVFNRITVEPDIADEARVALNRMLSISYGQACADVR